MSHIDYLKDMKFIQGQDRLQTSLFPVSLDTSIDQDNEVRLIDMFVDSLDLKPLGFDVDFEPLNFSISAGSSLGSPQLKQIAILFPSLVLSLNLFSVLQIRQIVIDLFLIDLTANNLS